MTTPDQEAIDALAEALRKPGMMLYLDGRNEHGSHVIPSYPTTIPIDQIERELGDGSPDLAEIILQEAERLGFAVGDLVWTEWAYNTPQLGEFGRVELAGYWEFIGINRGVTAMLTRGFDIVRKE